MALIVQKYGGTSVGSVEKIQNVADKLIAAREQGHDVVVVVSAMSGVTDDLLRAARAAAQKDDQTHRRIHKALLAKYSEVMEEMISMLVSPPNGRRPEAISYRTMPREKMSER